MPIQGCCADLVTQTGQLAYRMACRYGDLGVKVVNVDTFEIRKNNRRQGPKACAHATVSGGSCRV
jgi:hypothetical protein